MFSNAIKPNPEKKFKTFFFLRDCLWEGRRESKIGFFLFMSGLLVATKTLFKRNKKNIASKIWFHLSLYKAW